MEKSVLQNSKTHGIKFIDKVGYALGDMGGMLTFSLVAAFQNKFYTDVLSISPAKIAVLILVARLWDAINDPLWGAFIDSRKPTKYGRFRPYVLGFSIPLAVSAVFMYMLIPSLSESRYLLYAYITYILYGMLYTTVNIPYGSLASAVTDDEKERSTLSMFRSIGAGIGGLPGTILLPLIVYNTTVNADGTKIQTLNSTKLTMCVAVLSVVSVLVFILHFKLTKERVGIDSTEKPHYNIFRAIMDLLRSRPFVALCFVNMLLSAFQFYYQTAYSYLFTDYFHKAGLFSMVTIFTYLPMAIFIPIMNKMISRFGKKELCAFGMLIAALANFVLFFVKTKSPIVFLAFTFVSGMGQTFLVLEIWALVMDVTDFHENKTGRREEGTVYALSSFMRKLGQTLAGSGLNVLLGIIGYDASLAKQGLELSEKTMSGLYTISTLVPAVALLIISLLLFFVYNLSKKNLAVLHEEISKKHEAAALIDEG